MGQELGVAGKAEIRSMQHGLGDGQRDERRGRPGANGAHPARDGRDGRLGVHRIGFARRLLHGEGRVQHGERGGAAFWNLRCVVDDVELGDGRADAGAGARERVGIAHQDEGWIVLTFGPCPRRQFEADPGGIALRDRQQRPI